MNDFETSLTAKDVREILRYDPITGLFFNRIARGKLKPGSVAGTFHPGGYVIIRINYHLYRAHRLAWLYTTGDWPPRQIDHIDCDRHNNKWKNLRLATNSENQANTRASKSNTSGYKGVFWNSARGHWQAWITVKKRPIYLGRFDSPEDGHAAYALAAQQHFGDFARAS